MKLARPVETVSFQPLARGDKVGDYEVVAPLGSGGYGFVFKVRRAGRFFALKLLRARSLEGRGQREMRILRHLAHPNVVRFHDHGRWPHPEQGQLFFVMDFVEGRTLEEWALEDNPCARCVARVLLEVARALADIHARGVLHRDLKLENILMRTADGVPVLVDFGIGWLAGEPTLTRGTLPPGTLEYRSPEALRFARAHTGGQARYTPDAGDELWALGVILYWLLTDVLPFGPYSQRGNALNERILTERPRAPHEVNPRVPRALGELCLRMLEKRREARYATCGELAGALEAVLAGADASWDVPLVDPEAPERASTEEEPGKVPRDTGEREAHRWNLSRPRRGQKARNEPGPDGGGLPAVKPPAPAQEVDRPAPAGEAPGVVVEAGHAPAAPPSAVAEAAPVEAPGRGVPAAPAVPAGVSWIRAAAVPLTLVLLGAGALVGVWGVKAREAAMSAPAPRATEAPPPARWWAASPTSRPGIVREVAAPGGPSEAGGSAVAPPDSSPAPTSAPMPRQNDTRPKPDDKPAARPQRKALRCVPGRQETCVVGICTVLLTGCTGTPQVVRPPPRPADCPPGAVKTMEELGIRISDDASAGFPVDGGAQPVTVRESTPMQVFPFNNWGQLELSELTGRLYLGPDRVYGRFTQARVRRTGKTYPVCLELIGRSTRWGEPPGVEREDIGGPADAAVVFSTQGVRAVERFE